MGLVWVHGSVNYWKSINNTGMSLVVISLQNSDSLGEWKSRINEFLSSLCCKYPDFERWLKRSFGELPSGKRIVVLDEEDGVIRGLAILKNTIEEKKICTLRVDEKCRNGKIGTRLLQKSYKLLGTNTPLMTVNEEHIKEYMPFLKQNGAKYLGYVESLYYWGKKEYFFNQPYERRNVLMSIKKPYVQRIQDGSKRVEFRKTIFAITVRRVYVYETAPKKKIVGFFDIQEIVHNSLDNIWYRFSGSAGVTREEYQNYFGSSDQGYAIVFSEFNELLTPLDPCAFTQNFRPPQSFCYLNNVQLLSALEKVPVLRGT